MDACRRQPTCTSWQVVLEGERVNVAVTGPGATIALALQFLRTNDAAVAASFQLPQNAHSLDLVRFACNVVSAGVASLC